MIKTYVGSPSGVLGHSMGEISAATVAGVITLENAVRVVYYRAFCLKELEGKGKMIIARISSEDAKKYVTQKVAIAAINGEKSVSNITFSTLTFIGDIIGR
jgi:acyl transferase domain-containing protein